jgi:hypothetical protein
VMVQFEKFQGENGPDTLWGSLPGAWEPLLLLQAQIAADAVHQVLVDGLLFD